jgi:hypothetical protein
MKTVAHFFWRVTSVAFVAASLIHTHAQSELVFQDTFDLSPGTTEINEGVSGGRQSGTAGVVTYLESDETGQDGGLPFFTELFDNRLYLWANDNGEAHAWTWV